MSSGMGLWLPARAKVNLVLRITGRRADGYHLLETLFHPLDLHDDLWLASGPAGIDLQVTAERPELAVAPGPDNLVSRALAAFATATGWREGYRVQLHKRIPHGAGLGGGSSDAAAALRLANALAGEPLDAPELARLAVRLGADVPFFLCGGSQWGRGIGDELVPAHVEPLHFVLVVPPFGCPTVDVYKNYAALWKSSGAQDSVDDVTGPNIRDSALRIVFGNDLERAAERVRPALGVLRRRIGDLGFPDVRMTGSGSCLFVAFATARESERCAQRLQSLTDEGSRVLCTRSADAGNDVPEHRARPPG